MTVAVNAVLSQAGLLLNDVAATRWPNDTRLIWINEGLPLLAVKHPDAKVKRASITLVPGAKQTLPTDAIVLLEMRTANGPVLPCDRVTLDAFAPLWQAKPTSNSVKNFMYSPEEHPIYWVYPAQSATPVTVELVYSAYPAQATLGSNLDIQDKFASKLVDYLLYRALSIDAEIGSAERAVAYFKSFNA